LLIPFVRRADIESLNYRMLPAEVGYIYEKRAVLLSENLHPEIRSRRWEDSIANSLTQCAERRL
jgi:hypothetical protein